MSDSYYSKLTEEELDNEAFYEYQGAKDARKKFDEHVSAFREVQAELKKRQLLSSIWLTNVKEIDDYI